MVEFIGKMKITPKFGKCNPLFVTGHWTKKDIGEPYKVWCDENIYKVGMREEICEIVEITQIIAE